MERQVKGNAADLTISVMVFLGIILCRLKQLDSLACFSIRFIVYGTMFTYSCYQAIKLKNKTSIFFSIILFILAVTCGFQIVTRVW